MGSNIASVSGTLDVSASDHIRNARLHVQRIRELIKSICLTTEDILNFLLK